LLSINQNNYDMIDYGYALREGILEAYTGIVQGLKADGKVALLSPYVEGMVGFLRQLHEDNDKPEAVLRGAIGLLGDMADAFGPQLKQIFAADWVEALLKSGRSGRGASLSTKEVAKWAKQMVRNVINA
jgi:importin subunit beta-1